MSMVVFELFNVWHYKFTSACRIRYLAVQSLNNTGGLKQVDYHTLIQTGTWV